MFLAHGLTQKNTDRNLANGLFQFFLPEEPSQRLDFSHRGTPKTTENLAYSASDCSQSMLDFFQLPNGFRTSCLSRTSQWLKNIISSFLVLLSVLCGRINKEQLCH